MFLSLSLGVGTNGRSGRTRVTSYIIGLIPALRRRELPFEVIVHHLLVTLELSFHPCHELPPVVAVVHPLSFMRTPAASSGRS